MHIVDELKEEMSGHICGNSTISFQFNQDNARQRMYDNIVSSVSFSHGTGGYAR